MQHEKLNCYRGLIEIAPRLNEIIAHLPVGYNYLSDQLKRALSSAILNLAEGNAKYPPKERRRFFLTSRASLAEVSAILDILTVFNLLAGSKCSEHKSDLGKYYAMISNL